MMYNIETDELEHDLITGFHINPPRIIRYNDIEIEGAKNMNNAIQEIERISSDEHIIGLYNK